MSTPRLCSILVIAALIGCTPANSDSGTGGSGGSKGTGGSGGNKAGSSGGSSGEAGSGGSGSGGSSSAGSGGSSAPTAGSSGDNSDGATAGTGGSSDSDAGAGGTGAPVPAGSVSVLTNRFDNGRTGSNLQETVLTTSNVNKDKFGLLSSKTIKGFVFGQPLYVPGVMVGGAKHNVVYVATESNMIYAFDADDTMDMPLWSKMLGAPLPLGAGGYSPGCADMHPEVGITATPVISMDTGKIYVVSKTSGGQSLHALDLATGDEATGSPATIGANGFNAQIHLNRPGLLLANGVVYAGFGSHCDAGGYHGWVIGYDATTLKQTSVYNTTATGSKGAIWQSGVGLSSEGKDVWAVVGNGSGGTSMNVIHLTPAGMDMTVTSHYQAAANGDNDLTAGVIFLGSSGLVAAGGKSGTLRLLAQSDLSLKQELSLGGELHNIVYWEGSEGPMVYAWANKSGLQQYALTGGMLMAKGMNGEKKPDHPAGIIVASSNGKMAGTGIVWASVPVLGDAWHGTAKGALYAFDASDVSKPSLWNSALDPKDDAGNFAKFSPPTVANGKVYLATFSNKLLTYGLK